MSTYTITFKKDDIYFEIITSDKDFISDEMEKWVYGINNLQPKDPLRQLNAAYNQAKQSLDQNTTSATTVSEEKIVKVQAVETDNFSKVLKEQIKTKDEPEVITKKPKIEDNLREIIRTKKPETLLDFLITTAYYLSVNESFERFSLKQINSKLFNLIEKPIDHSVIKQAVSEKLIKVLPDFTGMADVTEYAITEKGENYFKNEIG